MGLKNSEMQVIDLSMQWKYIYLTINIVFDQVPTLDKRTLSIPINDIVQPGYTKRVVGEGMPLSKSKDAEKGDLVISFDIVFPTKLEVHQKSLLKQALL